MKNESRFQFQSTRFGTLFGIGALGNGKSLTGIIRRLFRIMFRTNDFLYPAPTP
jgi:hypothetical protein